MAPLLQCELLSLHRARVALFEKGIGTTMSVLQAEVNALPDHVSKSSAMDEVWLFAAAVCFPGGCPPCASRADGNSVAQA